MTKSLRDSFRYRKFVLERDKALEKLLQDAQSKISLELHHALSLVIAICSHNYSNIPKDDFFTNTARHRIAFIESQIDRVFYQLANVIYYTIVRLRRSTYLLTVTSEAEAIGQSLDKKTKSKLDRQDLDKFMMDKGTNEEKILPRIELGLTRIKRKVMDALELSRVMELPQGEMLIKIEKSFPKSYRVKVPRRLLKKVQEAATIKVKKDGEELLVSTSDTLIDQDEWLSLLDDYKSDVRIIPSTRFYNEEKTLDLDGEPRYNWEIESNLNHQFVEDVRDGQIEAANQNGITDFVWISVLDDKTDDCCEWRDGLTSSEIEVELDGKHGDDDCDAIVPPAHFNCRCTLAPIGEVPDKIESNKQDFEEWLNS